MMNRRQLLTGTAAIAAAALLPEPAAAARSVRVRPRTRWARETRLDADHHSSNPLPGPGDAALCHHATPTGVAIYSTAGNGNTYRHDGTSLHDVRPGVWVFGPEQVPDSHLYRYAGITSIIEWAGTLFGFVHLETHDDIAMIGQAHSKNGGWTWTFDDIIIEGTELLPAGFRGAASPRVVRSGHEWVMLYDNRHGHGRWHQTHRAVAIPGTSIWETQGPTLPVPGLYTETAVPVFSTHLNRWVCVFGSLDGWYSTTSIDLEDWDPPRLLIRSPKTGARWYPTLIDPARPDSTEIGRACLLTGHRITKRDRYVISRTVTVT